MRRGTVKSSLIKTAGHNKGVLEIEFQDGSIARYKALFETFKGLVFAKSPGTYFNDNIRGKTEKA